MQGTCAIFHRSMLRCVIARRLRVTCTMVQWWGSYVPSPAAESSRIPFGFDLSSITTWEAPGLQTKPDTLFGIAPKEQFSSLVGNAHGSSFHVGFSCWIFWKQFSMRVVVLATEKRAMAKQRYHEKNRFDKDLLNFRANFLAWIYSSPCLIERNAFKLLGHSCRCGNIGWRWGIRNACCCTSHSNEGS